MRYFRIFKIKAEERWAALVTLLFSVLLNGLVVWTYADKFMPVSHDHWQLFIRHRTWRHLTRQFLAAASTEKIAVGILCAAM